MSTPNERLFFDHSRFLKARRVRDRLLAFPKFCESQSGSEPYRGISTTSRRRTTVWFQTSPSAFVRAGLSPSISQIVLFEKLFFESGFMYKRAVGTEKRARTPVGKRSEAGSAILNHEINMLTIDYCKSKLRVVAVL